MADVKVRRPLWIRIALYGFAAVLFASAAIGAQAWYRQSGMIDQSLQTELKSDLAVITADIDAQKRAASALALAVAGEPEMPDLILTGNRDELIRRYSQSLPAIKEKGDLQLMTFADAKGTAVARMHTPEKFGDDMTQRRKTIVSTLRDGNLSAGIEPGRTALSVFATAPVRKDGVIVGVADVGTMLTEDYFSRLAGSINANIGIHIKTADGFETQSTTSKTGNFLTPEELQSVFDGKTFDGAVDADDKHYAVTGMPLVDFSGTKVGVLELASDVTEMTAAGQRALAEMVIGALVVSLLSLVGFLVFARALAGALRQITTTMNRLAAGDLTIEVAGKDRPDEIGAMGKAVEVFKDAAIERERLQAEAAAREAEKEEQRRRQEIEGQEYVKAHHFFMSEMTNGFERVSNGDLTARLDKPFSSDYEGVRGLFNSSIGKLEDTVGSVVNSIGAIRTGLAEITVASNDLAQRTEQQAASLEETVAALSEVTSA
ncbi:methyl-accepting chemotaxis protein, partial [Mangrovicella endophytica]|uniref:methyl-accepting chemotaxis protein n=1 Tax=Mangrovicella endophytica TaxID=2066697 RepID=UPI0012FFE3C0